MKTRMAWGFIIGGVMLAATVGAQRNGLIGNILPVTFAVLSVGYGLKLRRLAKRGIEDTRDVPKPKPIS